MDRLTRKSQSTDMVWFIDYENNNMYLEPCEMNAHHSRLAIEKLAYYEELEEQGFLLKAPCKNDSTGVVGKFVGIPIIEIPALISWLNDQKYINVDETSDNMTEEFEREHQWELSRNCFINNMIRKLEEIK